MNEALAAVENQVGLGLAPVAQCRRPLMHPSQIEQLLARLDDSAVHVADRDRRYLPSGDRDHGLVEQAHPLGDLAHVDQAPAHTHPGQRHQLGVIEAIADLACLGERGMRSSSVTFEDGSKRNRVAQVSLLHAVKAGVIKEPLPTVDPPATMGKVTPVQQTERQPERTTSRSRDLADAHGLEVRSRPRLDAVIAPADQVRGHRKPLQVLEPESLLDIRGGQVPARIPPRLALERLPTLIDPTSHGESLAHRTGPVLGQPRRPPVSCRDVERGSWALLVSNQ